VTQALFPFVGTFPQKIEWVPHRYGREKTVEDYREGGDGFTWGSLLSEHVKKLPHAS